MIWRKKFLQTFYFFNFCLLFFILQKKINAQKEDFTNLWLIKPESRLEERLENKVRLQKSICPTHKTLNDSYTILQSGTFIDVQWHSLQNFPLENVKLELLEAKTNILLARIDQPINDIIDKKENFSKLVKIPNYECKECILRLTVNVDSETQIVSCADVKIVPQNLTLIEQNEDCNFDVDCNNGGICYNNFCYCSNGFYGNQCSKKSQSFIEINDLDTSKFNKLLFHNHSNFYWRVNSKLNEIEYVLQLPTEKISKNNINWFILGIRPENELSNLKCERLKKATEYFVESNFQNDETQGVLIRKPFQLENSLFESNDKTLSKGKTLLNIKKINNSINFNSSDEICDLNKEFSTCPEFSRECEPSCDWTAFPESIPSCPKACGEPRCVCKPGFVRESNENDECKPFDFCDANEIVQQCPQNETWAKCGTACEPSCETMYNVDACTATCQAAACTCADNYVRFNGRCIFWANCPNLEEKFLPNAGVIIGDSEIIKTNLISNNTSKKLLVNKTTTDKIETTRQTDKNLIQTAFNVDSISNDKNELNCVTNETINECGNVCETNCVTIFLRGECNECFTQAACSCKQGFARNSTGHCVYWNDCPLHEINHDTTTLSNLDVQEFTNNKIFKNKKIFDKNTKKKEKLLSTLPISQPNILYNCFGEWSWPSNCNKDCDYKISWVFIPETDLIEFVLETKVPKNWWTGFGFTKTENISNADIIVVKSTNNGILSLHDMHTTKNGVLLEDEHQNVISTKKKIGVHANGYLRASFTRKRTTLDAKDDLNFDSKKCYKFLFFVSGGRLSKNGTIEHYIAEPHTTVDEICINSCPKKKKLESQSKPVSFLCDNEFRYPQNCELENCEYRAKWNVNLEKNDIEFQISSKGIGRWTGIGFSKTGKMENSDMYIGWVYNQKAYITDRFAKEKQMPLIDKNQNIYNISGSLHDDIQTISFRRKIITNDNLTDFSLNDCYYYLFPIGGGRVLAHQSQDFQNSNTALGYHDQLPPISSSKKICLCADKIPIKNKVFQTPPVAIKKRFNKRQINFKDDKTANLECSDVTLIKIYNKKIRIVDGFALSKNLIVSNEWLNEKSLAIDFLTKTDKDKNTFLLVKKSFEDSKEILNANLPNALYIAQGMNHINLRNATWINELTRFYLDNNKKNTVFQQIQATTSKTLDFKKLINLNDNRLFDSAKNLNKLNNEVSNLINNNKDVNIITQNKKTIKKIEPTTISTHQKIKNMIPIKLSMSTNIDLIKNDSKINEKKQSFPKIENFENCFGSFGFPKKCSEFDDISNCEYFVEWFVNKKKQSVDFRLLAKSKTNRWTGIGFLPNDDTTNIDVIVISVLNDSIVTITDQYPPDSISTSSTKINKMQDVFNIHAIYERNIIKANFSRSLNKKDLEDSTNLLTECQNLIFLPSNEYSNSKNNQLDKNFKMSLLKSPKICFYKCSLITPLSSLPELSITKKIPTLTDLKKKNIKPKILADNNLKIDITKNISTSTMPNLNSQLYDVSIKLTNKKYSLDLENLESETFKKLSNDIKKTLYTPLSKKWENLRNVRVVNFEPNNIANLQIEFDNENSPTKDELKKFLKDITFSKLVNTESINIDSNAIEVKENDQLEMDNNWYVFQDIGIWIIFGIVIFVCLLILLACILCIFRSSKRHKKHSKSIKSFSPHHVYPFASIYPTGITNAAFSVLSSKDTDVTKTSSTDSNLSKTPKKNYQIKHKSSYDNSDSKNNKNKQLPIGMGETTYQEWFAKVASKDPSLHFQENSYATPPMRQQLGTPSYPPSIPSQQSYVTYPNDPTTYYTLNGEHKLPPPSYYNRNY